MLGTPPGWFRSWHNGLGGWQTLAALPKAEESKEGERVAWLQNQATKFSCIALKFLVCPRPMPEDPIEALGWVLPELHKRISQASLLPVKLVGEYFDKLRLYAAVSCDGSAFQPSAFVCI